MQTSPPHRSYLSWPTPRYLSILVMLRFTLIPLILLCNVAPRSNLFPDPPTWTSNTLPIILVSLAGFSGGYAGSLSMVYGTQTVTDGRDQECAGVLMSLALTAGLLGGSGVSVALLS